MFWIAIAAQLSAPMPVHSEAWFGDHDFPKWLLSSGVSRLVGVSVTIAPNGKILGCNIEVSSRLPKLDSHTCALVLKRAKFRPAVWSDGTPSYGVSRSVMNWTIDAPAAPLPGDVLLVVDRLPEGARPLEVVHVMFTADSTGRPLECAGYPRPPKSLEPPDNPKLIPVACAQLLKNYTATPAKNESGKPVRSVQNVTVAFVVRKPN